MKASDIFHKTARGQSEIETRTNALSLQQRRVLILINGVNDAATVRRLSLCDNIAEIIDTLVVQGYINDGDTTGVAHDRTPKETDETVTELGAREFMCNTLLTFANRVRVGDLIEKINAIEDIDALQKIVNPWYQAIAETPGGMYQADDLRKEVLLLIQNEEIGGLQ